MLTPEELTELVEETLELETKVIEMGNETVISNRLPYALGERALCEDIVPEQKRYNDLLRKLREKQRIIEAHKVVAQYTLAYRGMSDGM